MNTNIILLIIGALIIGGGTYVLLQGEDSTSSATAPAGGEERMAQDGVPTVAENDMIGEGTLASLMARDTDITCEFTSIEEGVSSEGTFYYHDGLFRIDAESNVEGTLYDSNVIGRDDFVYVWGESVNGSLAIKLPAEDATESTDRVDDFAQDPNGSLWRLEEGVSYDCEQWRPNLSLFEPPADVTFMNPADIFENMFSDGLPEGLEIPSEFQQ